MGRIKLGRVGGITHPCDHQQAQLQGSAPAEANGRDLQAPRLQRPLLQQPRSRSGLPPLEREGRLRPVRMGPAKFGRASALAVQTTSERRSKLCALDLRKLC